MRGIEAFLEVLAASGVTKVFGNPGTTELPLNDALAADDRFQYILGLHEIPVLAMADGYAMASGHLGVANVHIACGVGNAMGMLYNAHCEGTPLLLTAGQQDRRLRFEEPVLEGDLVSVTRPWTKWAAEVQRAEDMPAAVRRAIQTAMTPPTGPVFLSLPVDVQLENANGLDLSAAAARNQGNCPAREGLFQAATLLAQAESPAIFAGSRAVEANSIAELVDLAEAIGAPVFAESATSHGRLPMPANHPLYAGPLPLWTNQLREQLKDFDVLVVVGANVFRQYIYEDSDSPISAKTTVVHLDSDPHQIGKNYPTNIPLPGNPKSGLAELRDILSPLLTDQQRAKAAGRLESHADARKSSREELLAEIARHAETRPMHPLAMMGALARALPANAAVIQEAATSHLNVLERLGTLRDPTGHFGHRGWALGWGVGCALGVKIAWPDRPVVALLGDGSALYGIQGLWTAAHDNIPVTFVICNNAQYQILKICGQIMSLPNLTQSSSQDMDLVNPEIDYVQLAQSLGVDAVRIDNPDDLHERLVQSFDEERPLLIDVPISREIAWSS